MVKIIKNVKSKSTSYIPAMDLYAIWQMIFIVKKKASSGSVINCQNVLNKPANKKSIEN